MATTKTLQDLYDVAYWIIAQGQDSTAYPLSLMRSFLNKSQNDICYGNVQNLQTNERLEKQALTFLEKNAFYSSHNYTTLSAIAVVWATTLSGTTTSLKSSGYVWINGAIISYSGNTGTQLTWIPASGDYSIPFAFIAGTQVFQLETLPTDFGQVSRAMLTLDTTRVRSKLIGIDDRDLASPTPNSYLYRFFFDRGYSNNTGLGQEWYYSMIRGQFVLFMLPQTNSQPVSFEYQKSPTQLVNTTDVLTIPDDYSLNTIPYMAVAEMLANRMEMDEAIRLNNFGFNNIKSMYQFYGTQRQELMYNQRVRTVSDWVLNV